MGVLPFILLVILAITFGMRTAATISSNDQKRSLSAVDKVRNHINSLKPDSFDDYLDHKQEWHQEKITGDR